MKSLLPHGHGHAKDVCVILLDQDCKGEGSSVYEVIRFLPLFSFMQSTCILVYNLLFTSAIFLTLSLHCIKVVVKYVYPCLEGLVLFFHMVMVVLKMFVLSCLIKTARLKTQAFM